MQFEPEHYKILLIEDDETLGQGIVDMLEAQNYGVIYASSGDAGLRFALREVYDLILLDVNLPKVNGWDILQAVVQERPGMPVIMLTAQGDESDRVRGLSKGADDYMVKPFSVRELLARIMAVLRRSPERPAPVKSIDLGEGVYLDVLSCSIKDKAGVEINFTSREYDLLYYFAMHPQRVISKSELLLRVWEVDPKKVETKSVEMTLMRLREKLGKRLGNALVTHRGRGYSWDPSLLTHE